jgi:hypothetical protein
MTYGVDLDILWPTRTYERNTACYMAIGGGENRHNCCRCLNSLEIISSRGFPLFLSSILYLSHRVSRIERRGVASLGPRRGSGPPPSDGHCYHGGEYVGCQDIWRPPSGNPKFQEAT